VLNNDKKRAIFRLLDFLLDSKKEIVIGGVEKSTQNLVYVAAQARNYFKLLDSSKESMGASSSVSKNQVQSCAFQPERTYGAGETLGIETYVFFMGSKDINRKLEALMALRKIAKDFPTQRALMHNYGVATRLVDIVRSASDQQLKIAAALTLAYILPALDSSMLASASGEARESLRIIEACDVKGFNVNGVNISSQEAQMAIKSLREMSGPDRNAAADGLDVMPSKNLRSLILSNQDLRAFYHEKKVSELVELLRFRSCRMLDAALLLVAMVNEDRQIGKAILSSEIIKHLMAIYYGTSTSDELRLAVALIMRSLIPFSYTLSSELRTTMSACSQFAEGKEAEAGRLVVKSLHKVHGSTGLKFEPTSYNYIQDRIVREIQANSLGLVCHSGSWKWDDVLDCVQHSNSGNAVRLTTKDPKNLSISFNMLNQIAAMQLVEDILGRLKVRDARNAEGLSCTTDRVSCEDSLAVPHHINISFADHPGFLGVSVFHLANHFLSDVANYPGLSISSKFNEIENLESPRGFVRERGKSTVCPIDGRKGAAYVHCLEGEDHVGLANHMLSWTWRYSVRDVVHTLSEYCKKKEYDPKRVYVWICCLW
jgi:hypothetical protein